MKKLWWLAVLPVFVAGAALADYAATPGSGLNFSSNILAGPVHYMANMLCDMTVGKTQCAAVNPSGQVSITGPVTQSGAWNVGQTGIWNTRLQDGSGNSISSTSGSLAVNCTAGCAGSGGTSSSFGAAFPSSGTAMGLKNGANMVNGTADAAGNMNVNIAAGLLPPNQAAMSASTPVVWASDQTPVKVTGMTGVIAPSTTPAGVNIKASAGVITSLQLGNIGSGPAYLKLYNKATAPTCNTDTPVKRLIIPAAATAANGAGSNVPLPAAINFSLGIGYCITGGLPDTDLTALAANTVLVNIDWQ